MEWPDSKSLQLIRLYREKRVLWDPSDENYKNIKKKADDWEEIATEMDMDVINVKKKIESLQGSYRRERQRQDNTHRSGAGTEDLYKSKWFAFSEMSFLNEKYKPRQTKDTINLYANKTVDNAEEPSYSSETDLDVTTCSTENTTEDHIENEHGKQQNELRPPIERKTLKKKRTCEVVDIDSRLNEAFTIMKSISEKKPAVSDDYSPFATYIDNKLKIFPPRERAILENQIQNLIFNAEMKQYTQPIHTQPFYFQNTNTQIPSNYASQNSHIYQSVPAQYSHQISNQQLQSVMTPPEQTALYDTDTFQPLPHTSME